ncbi:hypothetical protein QFC21_001833 [Naganishia friedmannii]|uniref:Uncharacterized protein n=1 Tax=Naganishia friedmannii TaxID=89922 RepID=A0ACC2W2Y7_9TREE|nr:hypothetical protein QFC21_001833 [Naganishia friedmannii]
MEPVRGQPGHSPPRAPLAAPKQRTPCPFRPDAGPPILTLAVGSPHQSFRLRGQAAGTKIPPKNREFRDCVLPYQARGVVQFRGVRRQADYHSMLGTSIKDLASLRNQQSRQHLIMELQHKANTLLGKLNDSLAEDREKSEVNAENSQERRKSGPATRGGTDIEKRQGWLKELGDVVRQLSDLQTEERNHDLPKSTSANSEADLDPSAYLTLPRSPLADSEGLMNGGTNAKPDDSGFTMHPNSEIDDLGDIDSVPDGDDDRRD